MILSIFVIISLAQSVSFTCAEYNSETFLDQQAILNYCDATGTARTAKGDLDCRISVDYTKSDNVWTISCGCKENFGLPDCSLDASYVAYKEDKYNTTPNTCMLEDLLVINQWKNDLSKYGHYVGD